MAIPGDRDVILGDESPAVLCQLWDLKKQFPEIPPDVVSSLLKKNNGDMSRCFEELEHVVSSPDMYGGTVSEETPSRGGTRSTMHNATPGTNHSGGGYSSHLYTPEQGMHTPKRDIHHQEYRPMEVEDLEGTSQLQFTSWASLHTGVSDLELQQNRRESPPFGADEPRHVSLCTVDMQKKPTCLRTESMPASDVVSGAGAVPTVPQLEEEPIYRQSSSLYGRTASNGMEKALDPSDFPFEPRPAWQDDPNHLLESNQGNERGASSKWTFTPTHMKPAEVQSPSQIATSYQLDPPKPSSPASSPQKGNQSASALYIKATDRISLKQSSSSATPVNKASAGASVMDGDDESAQSTASKQEGVTNSLMLPSAHPPDRFISKEKVSKEKVSKEKEDQAYTEALLMHQRARYDRLTKELEEEKQSLAHMRKLTSSMEQEVSQKSHHRAPFPTPEEITKLREQKRQLQIDIECMTREIESHKSQGLMDLTQANSFYGNLRSTGAPGPVPPIPPRPHGRDGSIIPETVIDTPPSPPSYESVMEGQSWSCSFCTLLNHPALDKCECCEMPRD